MKTFIMWLLLGSFTCTAQEYVSTITDTTMVDVLRQYIRKSNEANAGSKPSIDKTNTVLVLSISGNSTLAYEYYISSTSREDILLQGLPSQIAQVDGYWVLYYRIRPDELAPILIRQPDGYRDFIQKQIKLILQPKPPFETVSILVGNPPNQRTVVNMRDPRPFDNRQTWVVRCKAGQEPDVKIAL